MLLTFTNIGKQTFPQASQALDDMAIKMANGDVTQANFKDTAIQLGRALSTLDYHSLTREGVTLSDSQIKLIEHFKAMGDTVDAQKVIIQEIEHEFGGAAAASGSTFSGSVDKLKNSVVDLIAVALVPLMNKLTPLISDLAKNKPLLEGMGIAIMAVLVPAFIAWAISAGSAAVATIAATWPVLLVVAAIAALIAIIWILVANWSSIWGTITSIATQAWVDIQGAWNGAIDFFTKTLPDAIVSGVKWYLNTMIDELNFFINAANAIVGAFPGASQHTIPDIPHLAQGGTISGAGFALVGDVPEFVDSPQVRYLPQGAKVTPLSQAPAAKSGNSYTFNITNGQVNEQRLAVILRQHDMLQGAA